MFPATEKKKNLSYIIRSDLNHFQLFCEHKKTKNKKPRKKLGCLEVRDSTLLMNWCSGKTYAAKQAKGVGVVTVTIPPILGGNS